MDPKKLKQAREKIKRIMACPSNMVPADPSPRYDDVFFKGVEAMDKDQSISIEIETILTVSSTKYLLSMDEFHLCNEAVIELYKRGSKFIEVDLQTIEEMEKFRERYNKTYPSFPSLTLENAVIYHNLTLYNGHLLNYNSHKLESRCCPILFKLIDEWGLKGIARDEKNEQNFGIVEIPNNLEIEICEYELGGNYIEEKHRSWHMEEKK